ncbi:MAG: LysR family transcriptional regulator [Pseudomonadota bacterium]
MKLARLSLRIDFPNGTRFGPGKAALLTALHESGSIRAAATQLGMSYPRALKLIEQMNSSFQAPLVTTQHGGAEGGGTHVTELGQDVLQLYGSICEASEQASADNFQSLLKHIRE